MFICAAWKKVIEGPMDSRRTLVYRCDLEQGHEGDHVDNVLYVNWPDKDSDPECRPRNEWNVPRSIHINMNYTPMTLAAIHQMIMYLCNDGEVHVVNCQKMGASHALYLLQLMRKNLSEEDLEAIRQIVSAEIAKRPKHEFREL